MNKYLILKSALLPFLRIKHKDIFNAMTDDQILHFLFFNANYPRLTKNGYLLLKNYGTAYEFVLDSSLRMKDFISLEQTQDLPYYLTYNVLSLFDEEQASIVALYGSTTKWFNKQYNDIIQNV